MNTNKNPSWVYLVLFVFIRGLKFYISELIKPNFADDPLRGLQRSSGEAFAASCRVAEGDGIGGGIEADLVSARDRAGSIGPDVDGTRIAGSLHLIHQLQQCT